MSTAMTPAHASSTTIEIGCVRLRGSGRKADITNDGIGGRPVRLHYNCAGAFCHVCGAFFGRAGPFSLRAADFLDVQALFLDVQALFPSVRTFFSRVQ